MVENVEDRKLAYLEDTIPGDVQPWKLREALKLREWLRDETDEDRGILRWKTNGRVVPASVYADAFCIPPAGSADVERREGDEFLKLYRERACAPDEDQVAEMRAAFGRGTTVVNVITGIRTRL